MIIFLDFISNQLHSNAFGHIGAKQRNWNKQLSSGWFQSNSTS